MMFKDFEGFKKIKDVIDDSYNLIPDTKGVYIILFKDDKPIFLDESVGGHFKNKNPTVSVLELKNNWVEDEEILYISQAGGNESQSTLKKRLKQYFKFGSGKAVGHWGGRFIWQLKDSQNLVVAWKEINNDPDTIESEMINKFKEKYGKRPFANLTK